MGHGTHHSSYVTTVTSSPSPRAGFICPPLLLRTIGQPQRDDRHGAAAGLRALRGAFPAEAAGK